MVAYAGRYTGADFDVCVFKEELANGVTITPLTHYQFLFPQYKSFNELVSVIYDPRSYI